VLLSIGFLQPNKGFDRAIRAYGVVAPEGARLYVVGSVWREDEASVQHLAELRRLAAGTPGVELRDSYVDDEDFDRWIVASDALILPYRHGWSSNVMERGLLYDRPVVMSRVGGMAEQGADRPGVTLVADDAELAEALRRTVGDLVP
jgi:glycosyltransferase involved in cell wall biosynthesis